MPHCTASQLNKSRAIVCLVNMGWLLGVNESPTAVPFAWGGGSGSLFRTWSTYCLCTSVWWMLELLNCWTLSKMTRCVSLERERETNLIAMHLTWRKSRVSVSDLVKLKSLSLSFIRWWPVHFQNWIHDPEMTHFMPSRPRFTVSVGNEWFKPAIGCLDSWMWRFDFHDAQCLEMREI